MENWNSVSNVFYCPLFKQHTWQRTLGHFAQCYIRNKIGRANVKTEIRTRGCWVRSAKSTSVLWSPIPIVRVGDQKVSQTQNGAKLFFAKKWRDRVKNMNGKSNSGLFFFSPGVLLKKIVQFGKKIILASGQIEPRCRQRLPAISRALIFKKTPILIKNNASLLISAKIRNCRSQGGLSTSTFKATRATNCSYCAV